MFGDLGADNPKAFPRLRQDTQQGLYDAVLHVGEALARVRLEGWGVGGEQHQDRDVREGIVAPEWDCLGRVSR